MGALALIANVSLGIVLSALRELRWWLWVLGVCGPPRPDSAPEPVYRLVIGAEPVRPAAPKE